jgi:hypothetical protein
MGYADADWGGDLDERKSTFDMFSYLIIELSLGVVRNRVIYPYPQWKLNLWHFQQQYKKQFGLENF